MLFFFSSRRRHTRLRRDWSSDVCSSDLEFVDEVMARGFNLSQGANLPEVPHLFVEFHGSENGVKEQAELFGEIVTDMGGSDFEWSTNAEDRAALWKMRHNAYYAQKAHRPDVRVQNTDVCVPISRLADAVNFARVESRRLGLTVSMVGHAGDGNFNCGISVDHENEAEMSAAGEFTHNLNIYALELDGTVSGEHGIGIGKMQYMAEEHGDALQIMLDIKKTLDPQNIMNPGKMIPSN